MMPTGSLLFLLLLLIAARVVLLKVNHVSLLLKIPQWAFLSLGETGASVICACLCLPPHLVHA